VLAVSCLLPDELSSALMLCQTCQVPISTALAGLTLAKPGWLQTLFFLHVHLHVGLCTRQIWHIITTGSENSCHSREFVIDITHLFGASQYQAFVPLKSPSDVKFCCAFLANGHMESILNSKYPHFGVVVPLFPLITTKILLRTCFCSRADSYNLDFIC